MSTQQNYPSLDVSNAKGQNYQLITVPTAAFSKTAILSVPLLRADDSYNRSTPIFFFCPDKKHSTDTS